MIALASVAMVVSPSGIDECPGTPETDSSRLKEPFSDVPTLYIYGKQIHIDTEYVNFLSSVLFSPISL